MAKRDNYSVMAIHGIIISMQPSPRLPFGPGKAECPGGMPALRKAAHLAFRLIPWRTPDAERMLRAICRHGRLTSSPRKKGRRTDVQDRRRLLPSAEGRRSSLCLAVMVVLVFGNVVLRYGFNLGITVSEELSRLLFVWLTFLGAIVALREHGHLGVDMLVSRLPHDRQEGLPGRQPAADALRDLAVPEGQLGADADQSRREVARRPASRWACSTASASSSASRSASSCCTTSIVVATGQIVRRRAGHGQGIRGAGGARGAAERAWRRTKPSPQPTKSR